MNTQESDMEQMKFAREWVRAHAAKKMAKYEKKLRRAAKDFFGHPVAILYVYERIYKGETEMQTEFRKIPVNGKRTSVADQKRVRKIISDNAHRIAQECSVLVSYPKMRIEGTAVNLGDVHIMLPDCRIIDIEELKKI
jgi:hypothetical protein